MIKPLSRKDETSFKGSTSNYSHNRVTLSRELILPRFASCKGIQDSVWFRIPHHGFRIPDTGFRILCQWNLDSGLQSLVWFWIPWAVFRIPNPRVPYSKTIFRIPDSGFRIPDSLTWGATCLSHAPCMSSVNLTSSLESTPSIFSIIEQADFFG